MAHVDLLSILEPIRLTLQRQYEVALCLAGRRELRAGRDWKRSAAFAEAIFASLQSAMGSKLGAQGDTRFPVEPCNHIVKARPVRCACE